MDEKVNQSEEDKKDINDVSFHRVSAFIKLKKAITQSKKRLAFFSIIILLLLLFVSITIYNSFQVDNTTSLSNSSNKGINTSYHEPSPTPYPGAEIIPGSIKWNPKVEEVTPSGTLSLMEEVIQSIYVTSSSSGKFNWAKYYMVGQWTEGKYKGDNLYDVVISTTSFIESASFDSQNTWRVSVDGDKLILFTYADPINITYNNLNSTFPKKVIYDDNKIPGLLYSYKLYKEGPNGSDVGSIPFPVVYQNKTKNFYFEAPYVSDGFIPEIRQNYKFLGYFKYEQKLYGRFLNSDQVPWNQIEGNPYYVEDVDHSEGRLAWNTFNDDIISTKINWIKQPDLLYDLTGYHQQYDPVLKSADDISYSNMGFTEGCTHISIDKMVGDSKFDPSQLELVGSSNTHQIYRPTNANNLLYFMYDYISKNVPTLTFERYSASFPLLVYKDAFGTYQLMTRMDYPGHPQGCGKPVIYLYPTRKTEVKVSFSSPMDLTKTEPEYNNGWIVTAYPNGSLINKLDNKKYPYLYWEGFTKNQFPSLNYGDVVKKQNIKKYLITTLSEYGLNTTERNDFISYWLPYLNDRPYYLIRFYTTTNLDNVIPETIYPKPDSVLRILMEYRGLDKMIEIANPPLIVPFTRKGFTVIEWGGIYSN
jgi:hypothetical protein